MIGLKTTTEFLIIYPCIYENKFFVENVGGWGSEQPSTLLRGKRWQQKTQFSLILIVLSNFCFCHNNDYVPKIIRHKANLAAYSIFTPKVNKVFTQMEAFQKKPTFDC